VSRHGGYSEYIRVLRGVKVLGVDIPSTPPQLGRELWEEVSGDASLLSLAESIASITTAFPSVPHVQSASCPGVARLHLLSSLYGSAAFGVFQCNARGTATPNALLVEVDSSWNDICRC
jgi:hypothetical protein